jgi:hypothetical protein
MTPKRKSIRLPVHVSVAPAISVGCLARTSAIALVSRAFASASLRSCGNESVICRVM